MNRESETTHETTRRRGILARHPRLQIVLIALLFLLPICAMVVTVAIVILVQMQNAQ